MKRYEEETNLRCELVVDSSSSMYFPDKADTKELNKMEFAVHAAAAFIQLLRKQRDAVGLTIFNDTLPVAERARSSGAHLRHLMHHLEGLLSNGATSRGQRTDVVSALHDIAQRAHRRSLVVLLSDMLDLSLIHI